jgi:hypothetical protein
MFCLMKTLWIDAETRSTLGINSYCVNVVVIDNLLFHLSIKHSFVPAENIVQQNNINPLLSLKTTSWG